MADKEYPAAATKALPACQRREGQAFADGVSSVFKRQADPADTVF